MRRCSKNVYLLMTIGGMRHLVFAIPGRLVFLPAMQIKKASQQNIVNKFVSL